MVHCSQEEVMVNEYPSQHRVNHMHTILLEDGQGQENIGSHLPSLALNMGHLKMELPKNIIVPILTQFHTLAKVAEIAEV
jgi:hypothetical protein